MTPSQPLVELRGFTAVDPRTNRVLLNDINLTVHPGEQLLLLGASGAGKSTLLDAIRGVVPHSVPLNISGDCFVAGQPVITKTVAELSRTVGNVPQDPHASITLPLVEDEIALTLENHGIDPAEIGGRVHKILASVDAEHLLHHRTQSLSGGWVQRIATVAALAAEPSVVLADEPTSMLDGAGVAAVMQVLTELTGHDGALILVEHRLDELADGPGLPERTVVIDGGRIQADGPTDRVLAEHADQLEANGVWTPGVRLPVYKVPTIDAAAAPLLRAANLTVRPASKADPVVTNINLDIHAGERIAVMGANGTGKTTLLMALAGLLASDGEITGRPPVMVFQNPEHQFLAHSVHDELRFGLTPDEHTEAAIQRLSTAFGIDHLADLNPFRLSGGEKRRLSVATGLLAAQHRTEPTVLLADEPTFGLDRAATTTMLNELATHANSGGAVVIITHDHRLAQAWATRTITVAQKALI
ncbi:MAG TPA: energy-coupling factor ABC transporter ATP-binding protein [Enteractinococcus helveticum]|uniref:Energy-coupling factor ABC transporter ATP-binding protein n=1 Tax=Enteractinococcus helveticum TaxID=1837282 RepID=A0A921FQ95_9MICC|nr:ABC transporter ATP-binding protein [Enteractinococcus helveticum]HJF15492.1 energy-coupling factor ABC transporter ATP-binding protein [Enteractinococcus helveticum]